MSSRQRVRKQKAKQKQKVAPSSSAAKIDEYGFRSNTFDESNECSVVPPDLYGKLNDVLPKRWAYEWKYYTHGLICFAIYCTILVLSEAMQQTLLLRYNNLLLACVMSMPITFAMVGLIGIGHEAHHKSFAPQRTRMGSWLNSAISWLCLSSFAMSQWQWQRVHHIAHHKTVNQAVDTQNLHGSNIFAEWFWAVYYYYVYLWVDIQQVFHVNNDNTDDDGHKMKSRSRSRKMDITMMERVSIFCSAAIRIGLILQTLYFSIFILLSMMVALPFWVNYFIYLSHSIPSRPSSSSSSSSSKKASNNYFYLQLRETWDIFPQSLLSQFFHFGFGCHASHHIFGYLPRSLLPLAAKQLEIHCPNEYRKIDTISGEIWLFWNRFQSL